MDFCLPNGILQGVPKGFVLNLFYSCKLCTAFLVSFTDDFLKLIRESCIHLGVTSQKDIIYI